jgi:hypothetical protein
MGCLFCWLSFPFPEIGSLGNHVFDLWMWIAWLRIDLLVDQKVILKKDAFFEIFPVLSLHLV